MTPGDKRAYWEAQAALNGVLLAANPWNIEAALARGTARSRLGDHERAVEDFYLAATLLPPERRSLLAGLPALEFNNRAWHVALGPRKTGELRGALDLARKAVEYAPGEWSYRNTLGVVLYRLGEYEAASAHLERSLRESDGEAAAFNLYFLSMCYQRLGKSAEARDSYDRALRWVAAERAGGRLPAARDGELAAFAEEAASMLEVQ
jgi:tetratricopeptide (TPR) repeat protein